MKGIIDELLQPKCKITIKGFRKSISVDTFIDIGFSGDLCLPIPIAIQLGLELRGDDYFELADGSMKHELLFKGEAIWDNKAIPVEISLTESSDALLGVRLLKDKKITIDFPTKVVSIEDG